MSGKEPGFICFSAPLSVTFAVEIGILQRKYFFIPFNCSPIPLTSLKLLIFMVGGRKKE